jgi:hypothetical protein
LTDRFCRRLDGLGGGTMAKDKKDKKKDKKDDKKKSKKK